MDKLQIGITELDSSWNSTIQEFASDPIIRHFAGDPFPLKLLLMAEYVLARISPRMSTRLTDKEKLIANNHYLNGRNEIFKLQITLQEKTLRILRRIWSKIGKTPRYKYK